MPDTAAYVTPRPIALSDLHVGFPENRDIIKDLQPRSSRVWPLLAGDVGDLCPDIEWALHTLSARFTTMVAPSATVRHGHPATTSHGCKCQAAWAVCWVVRWLQAVSSL